MCIYCSYSQYQFALLDLFHSLALCSVWMHRYHKGGFFASKVTCYEVFCGLKIIPLLLAICTCSCTISLNKCCSDKNDVSLCWMFYYSLEFPAGEVIKCLLGLDNNGKNDFIVEIIEASLRWWLLKVVTKLSVNDLLPCP